MHINSRWVINQSDRRRKLIEFTFSFITSSVSLQASFFIYLFRWPFLLSSVNDQRDDCSFLFFIRSGLKPYLKVLTFTSWNAFWWHLFVVWYTENKLGLCINNVKVVIRLFLRETSASVLDCSLNILDGLSLRLLISSLTFDCSRKFIGF